MQSVHARGDGLTNPTEDAATSADARGRAPEAARRRLLVVVAGTGVLVVAGAVLAARAVGHDRTPSQARVAALPPPSKTDIGRDIRTSFGVVAAESVSTLGGLGARPLAGVTHGIQNLVGPKQMQVQVLVALTNLLPRPVHYTPLQFRLRVPGRARSIRLTGATFHDGILQPHASIEGKAVFVAPRTNGPLVLQFTDRHMRIPIDLGRATPGRAPPSYHQH